MARKAIRGMRLDARFPSLTSFLPLFGLVRGIEAHGLYMNARASVQIASQDGDPEARSALNLQTGLLGSALEHAIPEQIFPDPEADEPAEAVSAVKALGMAMQQGQRIYELTPENMTETLPKLNLGSQAMGEITRALQTGQQVIAHTDPVQVPGWRGAGYILLDPFTGDGAYKISGGTNGGSCGCSTSISRESSELPENLSQTQFS